MVKQSPTTREMLRQSQGTRISRAASSLTRHPSTCDTPPLLADIPTITVGKGQGATWPRRGTKCLRWRRGHLLGCSLRSSWCRQLVLPGRPPCWGLAGPAQPLTYVQDNLSDDKVFHPAACSSLCTAPAAAGRGMGLVGPLGAVGSAGLSAVPSGVVHTAGTAGGARPRSAWGCGSRCAGAPASPPTTLPSWRCLAPLP